MLINSKDKTNPVKHLNEVIKLVREEQTNESILTSQETEKGPPYDKKEVQKYYTNNWHQIVMLNYKYPNDTVVVNYPQAGY